MGATLRPPVRPAGADAAAPAEAAGIREAWLKAGILLCAAGLAGVLWGAAVTGADDAPAPRVEVQPKDDDILYEDQYVRVWADTPAETDEESTETPP